MKKQNMNGISRRSFMKGAAVGATLAGLAGSSVLSLAEEAPAEEMPGSGEPVPEEIPAWLGEAPGITDDMCEADMPEADVVIVGAGVAGIAAARAAVEDGASVIVLEQTADPTVRGLVFGALDSQFQKDLGCSYDKQEVVNEICRSMGNRVNASLWKKWADESGETFDWFESVLDESDTHFLEFWPNPEAYDNSTELRKQYCTGIEFVDWVGAVMKQYNKSVEEGAVYMFNTPAVELAKEDGVITGVYAQKEDGSYIKVLAKNGVILTTGDYGHNVEMVKALCPEFYRNCGNNGHSLETSMGYGHRMAIWAGGMMEPGPHAHMDHTFADMFGIGNAAALNLNAKGKRYMNEDCDGQSFTNQMVRQPGMFGIQVFDNNWQEMVKHQAISHGMPNPVTMDFEATQAMFDGALENPNPFFAAANTLDELFEIMGLPVEQAKASVERYNELCHAGKDEDFGKRADRMYPVETPPFYAAHSILATGVMTAGVVVDENLKVLDANYDPIPHLWAAGNVAGGRYACEYPVAPVVATSHGTAITFGRSCGRQAAKGEEM